MTDNTDLKRLAQRVIDIEALDGGEPIGEAWGEFEAAATPAAVLALIAEIEALKGPHDWLAEDLIKELVDNAQAIQENADDGEDDPFVIVLLASASRIRRQEANIDKLRAENERLAKTADCWDRLNVQNKALSDSFRAERDQLKAENAGLKTGYEAYERVNAELKAENERLVAENTDIESAVITYIEDMQEAQYENERLKAEVDSLTREADRQYTTIEAYRRDVERFQWLLKNASVILDKKAAYQAENGFIKFDTMPGRTETELAIDAAMGKGEQS